MQFTTTRFCVYNERYNYCTTDFRQIRKFLSSCLMFLKTNKIQSSDFCLQDIVCCQIMFIMQITWRHADSQILHVPCVVWIWINRSELRNCLSLPLFCEYVSIYASLICWNCSMTSVMNGLITSVLMSYCKTFSEKALCNSLSSMI